MTKKISSEDEYSEKTKRLIKKVECNISFEKLKRTVFLERLWRVIPNVLFIIVIACAFFYIYKASQLYLTIVQGEGNIEVFFTTAVSIFALFMAINAFMFNVGRDVPSLRVEGLSKQEKEYMTNRYFRELRKEYTRKRHREKEDLPLLKALIMMKCKQPDINLEEIYERDASMFEEKRLLRSLYE